MEFWEWITKKYIEWRGDSRATISEFAKYIGVTQPVMSDWMKRNGKIPSTKSVGKIAKKYPDIYEILELPSPVEQVPFSSLPTGLQEQIKSALFEIEEIMRTRSIQPDSPEGVELSVSVLKKHGFNIKSIK